MAATGNAPEPATPIRSGIEAAAVLIMVGNLLSRVLGLVREQLAAGMFGTGDRIAAFQIADNVHTLLFDLVISGMLQAALIPVLVQWAAPELLDRAELKRVTGALLTIVVVVVGGAVALGVIFAPQVVRVMTALGGSDDRSPETTQLTVELVRLILPAVFFLALGTLLMSVLYAMNRVAVPALSLAVRNLAVVAIMVLFSGTWGVKSMAVGVVVGAVLIAVMNGLALRRADAVPSPNVHIRHPGVGQILRLYLPIFLGLIVSTIAVVIDRNLAWRAEEEALGAMRYATTLVQFVLGLVAAAISLAALPTLAAHFSRRDDVAFQRTLERALTMVAVLIIPATFGLAAAGRPLVEILFEHGETTANDGHLIFLALVCYLPGTFAAAFDQVLIYGFYARRNTWLPVIVGIGATLVYGLVALSAGRAWGMTGLVIANSAQFIAHAGVMAYFMRKQLGTGDWSNFAKVCGKSVVASTAMAVLVVMVWQGLDVAVPDASEPISRAARQLLLAGIPVLAGAATYALLLDRFRVNEARELREAVLSRIPLPFFAR